MSLSVRKGIKSLMLHTTLHTFYAVNEKNDNKKSHVYVNGIETKCLACSRTEHNRNGNILPERYSAKESKHVGICVCGSNGSKIL